MVPDAAAASLLVEAHVFLSPQIKTTVLKITSTYQKLILVTDPPRGVCLLVD